VLFPDAADYLAFQVLLAHALRAKPIRLLGYCLMPNHWHLALWPTTDDEISVFVRWFSAIHARRLHRKRGSSGCGAVYQSRFKAVPVHCQTYFYQLLRYIERNAVRAELCTRAQDWPWSSASPEGRGLGIVIADWPLERPAHWLDYVNDAEPSTDVDFIRTQTASGEPIGPLQHWIEDDAILV
jgi:putative transposase